LKKDQTKILFISTNETLYKSTANLKFVDTVKLSNLLIEKILHYDVLIFSKDSYKELEGRV
jgi:large subunit ribosomal protein L4